MLYFWLCYRLFHLHSEVKIRPFFQFSPWRAPRLRHFSDYLFGASKKASTIFFNTVSENSPLQPYQSSITRFVFQRLCIQNH